MRPEAAAKVNLFLRVLQREPGGYHRIQTLFCALELADTVHVALEESPGIRLEVEGADLGPSTHNLAYRAAAAFLEHAGPVAGVSIRLRKRIPAGGGLGGGSSDAAAVLRALDTHLPGHVPPERLDAIARRLGSDVPFFLRGGPLAWGEGFGERLTPLPPLPSRPVVLVVPPFPIATAAAYAWLDEDRDMEAEHAAPVRVPSLGDWEAVAGFALNDFEAPVFRRHPLLRELRDGLAAGGAVLALLAGSGSTIFGVFPDDARAAAAARAIATRAPAVRVVRTRTAR